MILKLLVKDIKILGRCERKQLLINVCKTLDKAGIPYMVIGGQAILFYYTPRLTKDIDIIVEV